MTMSALLVSGRHADGFPRGAIGAQLVGDQDRGRVALLLEQLAHELHGRRLVAPPLDQQVEHLALVVDGAPEYPC